jgi:hypothetical protein
MRGQCSSQVNVETGLFYVVVPTFFTSRDCKMAEKEFDLFQINLLILFKSDLCRRHRHSLSSVIMKPRRT